MPDPMTDEQIVAELMTVGGLENTIARELVKHDEMGGDFYYWLPLAEGIAERIRSRIDIARGVDSSKGRLRDLFGIDPLFTGGMDPDDYVRLLRGES